MPAFEINLAEAAAVRMAAQNALDRATRAFKAGAAAEQEVVKAPAAFDAAKAAEDKAAARLTLAIQQREAATPK